ncbi:helix-turn-helix transcriptional regulator [Allokutzneria multivorans]|uniref:Helix-turn-helix transcriptional regulator n=2 Tax=Allokutzneria multivorans TaxID=1142134 RepID=A0ABP7SF74_9PSEU
MRARREGLRPRDFGLPTAPRRTPGLRREEVAELAHVSVDYYSRLEQARGPHPSPRVLSALADALRLSAAERAHLFRLGAAPGLPASPKRQVTPSVAAFLNRLPDSAAVVTDAGYDVIAWNALANALLGDLAGEPNIARRWFLGLGHPMEVSEGLSRVAVARLRAASSRYPGDVRISGVVTELTRASAEFRELWAADPVHSPGHCDRTVLHPEAGALELHSDVLTVPDVDQQVVFLTAAGAASRRWLDLAGQRLARQRE